MMVIVELVVMGIIRMGFILWLMHERIGICLSTLVDGSAYWFRTFGSTFLSLGLIGFLFALRSNTLSSSFEVVKKSKWDYGIRWIWAYWENVMHDRGTDLCGPNKLTLGLSFAHGFQLVVWR